MKKQIEDLVYLTTTEILVARTRHEVSKRHGKFRYENNRKYKKRRERR